MAKAIAFYLPQYHPVPENNEWWGAGFTEWTNVAKARPVFSGHYQPHQPADLGYYDLRLGETREAQAELATEYGIGGFATTTIGLPVGVFWNARSMRYSLLGNPIYHSAFAGRTKIGLGVGTGRSGEILLQQIYSAEDDRAHFESLLPAFTDPRYLKKDGCPIFLFYSDFSSARSEANDPRWREMARAHGLPGLYLCCVESLH